MNIIGFARRVFLVLGAVGLLSVALWACASPGSTLEGEPVTVYGGVYRTITADQLHSWLDEKDFLLVNVHVPYVGEIPGTDEFVPYNETEARASSFPLDKTSKIVVYCRSGQMSSIAAKTLVGLGYTNVWNLDEGMIGWEKQGYLLAP